MLKTHSTERERDEKMEAIQIWMLQLKIKVEAAREIKRRVCSPHKTFTLKIKVEAVRRIKHRICLPHKTFTR